MTINKIHVSSRLVFVLFVGGLLFLIALPMWVQAAPPALPTRPIPTATPIPTLTATLPITSLVPPPESSLIVLVARSEAATTAATWRSIWTVVEWQDDDGAWQVVAGWQATLDAVTDSGGRKTWSVPPSLFGRGPFRWGVMPQRGGLALAYSEPFNLPAQAGETLEISVTIAVMPRPILLPMTGATWSWGSVFLGLALLVVLGGLVKRRSLDL